MKRVYLILLCVALVCALFVGCDSRGSEAETDLPKTEPSGSAADPTAEDATQGISYNGMYEAALSPQDVVDAEGREADVTVEGDNDSTTMIYNEGDCFGIDFDQVQYSIFDDHTQVTCCYTLKDGETMEAKLEEMTAAVSAEYGEPSTATTTSGTDMMSWSDGVSGNLIRLYAITDTAIRLQFTLGF